MPAANDKIAVVIVAGGKATRLPGKLEIDAGGKPLLLRVYENVKSIGPVYVSANRSFAPEIDAALECPVVIDRWPDRGPLAGLYSALAAVREERVFAVAGDAPFVDARTVLELARHWEPGIQAVIPVNAAGRLEPLCALYDRMAVVNAAPAILRESSGGVALLVERLRSKRIRLPDERVFANVNTPAERRAYLK
jgi:molybdopterin-guanine dinucleotide biosynthesis protein A